MFASQVKLMDYSDVRAKQRLLVYQFPFTAMPCKYDLLVHGLLSSFPVKLMGYCVRAKQRLLVYQFLPNGSLADHLHGEWVDKSISDKMK